MNDWGAVITGGPFPLALLAQLQSTGLGGAQPKGARAAARHPPKQTRLSGWHLCGACVLQLEKAPRGPWQMIWFWGALKREWVARPKESPQRSFRQNVAARWETPGCCRAPPQLSRHTVCHECWLRFRTCSWPWHLEWEPVSLTWKSGGREAAAEGQWEEEGARLSPPVGPLVSWARLPHCLVRCALGPLGHSRNFLETQAGAPRRR